MKKDATNRIHNYIWRKESFPHWCCFSEAFPLFKVKRHMFRSATFDTVQLIKFEYMTKLYIIWQVFIAIVMKKQLLNKWHKYHRRGFQVMLSFNSSGPLKIHKTNMKTNVILSPSLRFCYRNISTFCWTIDTLALDFWRRLPWGLRLVWIPYLCASTPAHGGFLRFICGATPANLSTGSMAAESLLAIYLFF